MNATTVCCVFVQYVFHVIYTAHIIIDFCCVWLTDNTGSAGELFPDTGGPGFGVPASPQRPGHSSALSCSP